MSERIEPIDPVPPPIDQPPPDPNPLEEQPDLTDLRRGAEQVARTAVDRIRTVRDDAERRAARERRRADELREREEEAQRLSRLLEAA